MLALVFPGQGSQKVGMGQELARDYPEARDVFKEADEILGLNLSQLCFTGPDDRLKLTAIAQPALLCVSIATLRVLERHAGVRPAAVAGHSLGEYSALVCAGALAFEDALRVVRQRGEFMQQAVPAGEGGMAAVLGLERPAVEELCREAAQGAVLGPANDNAPHQIVVAGHAEALARMLPLVEKRGGKALPLNVSAPFHCPLMRPAADRLRERLGTVHFSPPQVPVISNVNARPYGPEEDIADVLYRQVTSPVRWTESVRALKDHGIERVLEVGPGRVLSGLIEQIDGTIRCENVETTAEVYGVERRMEEQRLRRLESEGWVRKGDWWFSPDGMRIILDDGLEWDATAPGACGF